MIEKFSGTFRSVRRFESKEELVNIFREYVKVVGGNVFRFHVYSDDSDALTMIYLLQGSARCVKYLLGSSTFEVVDSKSCINGLPDAGYVEVYSLDKDQYLVDLEIFESVASVMGVNVSDIMAVADLEFLGTAEAGGDLHPQITTQSVLVHHLTNEVSSELSRMLGKPYIIGKILLEHEEYNLRRTKPSNVAEVFSRVLNSNNYIAIKLETGDSTLWLLRLGDVKGIKVVLDGTQVTGDRLDSHMIEKLLTSIQNAREILIHEYRLGQGFVNELKLDLGGRTLLPLPNVIKDNSH